MKTVKTRLFLSRRGDVLALLGRCMKLKLYVIALVLSVSPVAQIRAQGIQATNLDGGTVVTELGFNIKVNEKSALRRTWTVLNDPSCPIQLSDAGIKTLYRDHYIFNATGSAKTSKPVQAFEIRYLLYDVFGEHLRTLSSTEVTDLPADFSFQLGKSGTWRAWETDVSQLLTVVAFVAQFRGEDGKIWRYNQKAIGDELGRIQLKVTGVFDPTKDKEK
jgi:hypothetical protein